VPYRLGMAAMKLPTRQHAADARRILLDGLAAGTGVADLMAELEPLHFRYSTFPGEVFLAVAADALDWCGASRAEPLVPEDMRKRFLPEYSAGGRRSQRLRTAILAAAALRGGVEPDLLDQVVWGDTDDFWPPAMYVAIAYVRAAADRGGVPVAQVCRELAERVGPVPGWDDAD
jgi:hypothetical protein